MLIRHKPQLFSTHIIDREECFDVIHHRVGFRLFGELGFRPVLRLVVNISLGCEVVGLDQLSRQSHHSQCLGETLDGIDGQGAFFSGFADFEVPFPLVVGDVGKASHREAKHRLAFAHDLLVDLIGSVFDAGDGLLVALGVLSLDTIDV